MWLDVRAAVYMETSAQLGLRRMSGKDDRFCQRRGGTCPVNIEVGNRRSCYNLFCHDNIHSSIAQPHRTGAQSRVTTKEQRSLSIEHLFDYESTSSLLFIKNIQHKITLMHKTTKISEYPFQHKFWQYTLTTRAKSNINDPVYSFNYPI